MVTLLKMNDNKLITLQLGTQVIGLIAEDYASLDLFIKVVTYYGEEEGITYRSVSPASRSSPLSLLWARPHFSSLCKLHDG